MWLTRCVARLPSTGGDQQPAAGDAQIRARAAAPTAEPQRLSRA